jgi:molybdenum cofactor cytidylyltransferase
MRFLPRDADNLNPILRKMIQEGVEFYGVPHQDEVELLNINRYDDYLKVLEFLKDKKNRKKKWMSPKKDRRLED